MLPTPDPEALSDADSVTDTAEEYAVLAHAVPLQEMVLVGAVESTFTVALCTASALFATSVLKYLIVVVVGTLNAALYTVLDVVGEEPSVV
jgi:hypothetical protein